MLTLVAFASTLAGGAMALRFRDRLHYLLGFTAGVLLGVVAFDLLPELFVLAHEHGLAADGAMFTLVVGFLLFHSLEKFVLVHPAQEEHYSHHHHPNVGLASASVLAAHSCMDGVAIGIGFQVSPAVGLTVAIAVIAHDFSDGLNTVSLMLRHRNSTRRAFAMLVVDALAPLLGVLLDAGDRDPAVPADALPRLLRRVPSLHRRLGHPARGSFARRPRRGGAADRADLLRRRLRLRRDALDGLTCRRVAALVLQTRAPAPPMIRRSFRRRLACRLQLPSVRRRRSASC